MNFANIAAPNGGFYHEGGIDPEVVELSGAVGGIARFAGQTHTRSTEIETAEVVVREWDHRLRRMIVVYEGPLRVDHVKSLAAGKKSMDLDTL